MSRALKFTLLVGVQIAWVLTALYLLNPLAGADAALARAFGLGEGGVNLRAHPVLQVLSIVLLGFGTTWVGVMGGFRAWIPALVAVAAMAETFTLAALLALYGQFFSPWLPVLAAGLGWAAGVFYGRTPLGRRAGLVERVFGGGEHGRVSTATVRALADDGRAPVTEAAGGMVAEVTIIVVEIVNYPALLSARTPADTLARINRFQALVAGVLRTAGGCVTARGAEGVRAVFGPPLSDESPGHAVAACRGALETVRRLRTFNEEEGGGGNPPGVTGTEPLDARVGVHSGEAFLGCFGPDGYGVAGEETDFARYLCAANGVYGSTILLGARTYELAEGKIEVRPLELLPRAGGGWREIYELLDESDRFSETELARRDLFWTGVIFYREGRYADALERFAQARRAAIDYHGDTTNSATYDGPLEYYILRVERLLGTAPPTLADAEENIFPEMAG